MCFPQGPMAWGCGHSDQLSLSYVMLGCTWPVVTLTPDGGPVVTADTWGLRPRILVSFTPSRHLVQWTDNTSQTHFNMPTRLPEHGLWKIITQHYVCTTNSFKIQRIRWIGTPSSQCMRAHLITLYSISHRFYN